jgi:hypothetical protein
MRPKKVIIIKRRGSREAECTVERLLLSRHSVRSESDTDKEQTEGTDKKKEKEQRSIMASVEGLLRSRDSVGSENDTITSDP